MISKTQPNMAQPSEQTFKDTQEFNFEELKCEDIEISGDGKAKGWLKKKSKYLKSWRNRWMILKNYKLVSYKNKDKATETIDLLSFDDVVSDNELGFEIYKGTKSYFAFKADTLESRDLWVKYINAVIIRSKKLVQNQYE
eukprot:261770_1